MKICRTIQRLLALCAAWLPAACIMDDATPDACPADTRPVEVSLGVRLTRAVAEGTTVGDVSSTPHDMKVWMFDQDGRYVDYFVTPEPVFAGSDALGELVNTTTHRLELPDDVTTLTLYVVLNSDNADDLTLDGNSSPSEILDATFSGLATELTDNQVPIAGKAELQVDQPRQSHYEVSIEAKRAVGKLELLFTKDSPSAYLEITRAELTQIPKQGSLFADASFQPTIDVSQPSISLMNTPAVINASLLPDMASVGHFSQYAGHFQSIDLQQSYLLENPYGGLWTATGDNTDYVYPDETNITAADTRYLLTLTYRTAQDEPDQTQLIYLPAIKRNEWNKIFARVKSDGYELQLQVVPWQLEEVEVNFEDELSYTSEGWDEETILSQTGTQIQLRPNQAAVLRFTIQTPNTATWRATLTGADPDAFLFVGDSSGAGSAMNETTGQLEPVEQVIRIEPVDPNSTETHEAVLHVYADIGGVTYELDLTEGDHEPDDGQEVRRFTLLQRQ